MSAWDVTDGGRVIDLYAISVYLKSQGWSVPPATLRQWAHRYPDELPTMGLQRRRRLYAIADAERLCNRIRGPVAEP